MKEVFKKCHRRKIFRKFVMRMGGYHFKQFRPLDITKIFFSRLVLIMPVFAIQTAVLHGFGQMLDSYIRNVIQIGNGTGHFENAVIGTGTHF